MGFVNDWLGDGFFVVVMLLIGFVVIVCFCFEFFGVEFCLCWVWDKGDEVVLVDELIECVEVGGVVIDIGE